MIVLSRFLISFPHLVSSSRFLISFPLSRLVPLLVSSSRLASRPPLPACLFIPQSLSRSVPSSRLASR